ncbi:unnamed protein product [Tuwongella immobilis]|uniref:Uncharacterized protein n=1 Tax=Tuwongella immobilis TaxID=692036 RepID=A0A6C2YJG8_9BACT|nr:unnamed protein product [Tuwongella immobilis]VTR97936.1 unnamed protein product [Tuwongella immobilis]
MHVTDLTSAQSSLKQIPMSAVELRFIDSVTALTSAQSSLTSFLPEIRFWEGLTSLHHKSALPFH